MEIMETHTHTHRIASGVQVFPGQTIVAELNIREQIME